MKEILSYVWSSRGDSKVCKNCWDRDGIESETKPQRSERPPLKTCTNPDGCRCRIMVVYERAVDGFSFLD